VEIWAEADREPNDDVYNLLTIHNDRLPCDFIICQWQRALILRATAQHRPPPHRFSEADLDEALPRENLDFSPSGAMARNRFYSRDCRRTLSAIRVEAGGDDWSVDPRQRFFRKTSVVGSLFGLAIYNRALNTAEISGTTISGRKVAPGN